MIRWLGVGVLLGTAACASAAVAQLPISPVYRPGPEQAQPAPDNGGASGEGPRAGDGRRAGECAARETGSRRTAAGSHGADPAAASARRRRRERGRGDALSPGAEPARTGAAGEDPKRAGIDRDGRNSAAAPVRSGSGVRARPSDGETAPDGDAGNSAVVIAGDENREVGGGVPKRDEKGQGPIGAAAGPDQTARTAGGVPSIIPGRYYARSLGAYPDRTRGYGGGLYGPSPYSSEGP